MDITSLSLSLCLTLSAFSSLYCEREEVSQKKQFSSHKSDSDSILSRFQSLRKG